MKIWTKEGLYFYHRVQPPFSFSSLFIFASSFFLFFCCISNGSNNNKSCHHRSSSFPNNSVVWGGFSCLLLTSISSLAPFVATLNGQTQRALPCPCFCLHGCLWVGTNCMKRRKEEKNKRQVGAWSSAPPSPLNFLVEAWVKQRLRKFGRFTCFIPSLSLGGSI